MDRPTLLAKFLDMRLTKESNKDASRNSLYIEHSPQLIRAIIACPDGVWLIRHVATSLNKSEYVTYSNMCAQLKAETGKEYRLDPNEVASVFEFCGVKVNNGKVEKTNKGRLYKGIEEFIVIGSNDYFKPYLNTDMQFITAVQANCKEIVATKQPQTLCGMKRLYGVCAFLFEHGDYSKHIEEGLRQIIRAHCQQSINYKHLCDLVANTDKHQDPLTSARVFIPSSGRDGVGWETPIKFAKLFPQWGTFDAAGECKAGTGADTTTLTSKNYLQDELPSEENPDGGILFKHFKSVAESLNSAYTEAKEAEMTVQRMQGLLHALINHNQGLGITEHVGYVQSSSCFVYNAVKIVTTYFKHVTFKNAVTDGKDTMFYNNMATAFKNSEYVRLFECLDGVDLLDKVHSLFLKSIKRNYTSEVAGTKLKFALSPKYVEQISQQSAESLLLRYRADKFDGDLRYMINDYISLTFGAPNYQGVHAQPFKELLPALCNWVEYINKYGDPTYPVLKGEKLIPVGAYKHTEYMDINDTAVCGLCDKLAQSGVLENLSRHIVPRIDFGIFMPKSGNDNARAYNSLGSFNMDGNRLLSSFGAWSKTSKVTPVLDLNKAQDMQSYQNFKKIYNADKASKTIASCDELGAFFIWHGAVHDVLLDFTNLYIMVLWLFMLNAAYYDFGAAREATMKIIMGTDTETYGYILNLNYIVEQLKRYNCIYSKSAIDGIMQKLMVVSDSTEFKKLRAELWGKVNFMNEPSNEPAMHSAHLISNMDAFSVPIASLFNSIFYDYLGRFGGVTNGCEPIG